MLECEDALRWPLSGAVAITYDDLNQLSARASGQHNRPPRRSNKGAGRADAPNGRGGVGEEAA
jgi:hypothetical protein